MIPMLPGGHGGLRGPRGLMPRPELGQTTGENGIIPDVPMIAVHCCEGHCELGHPLELRCCYFPSHRGPVRHSLILEAGIGHLTSWWSCTQVDNRVKPESSEVLRRPGLIRVSDVLLGFHV